jgi:hypothetical protein
VVDQARQSGRVFDRIRTLNPNAPVEAFVGRWRHSAEERSSAYMRFALQAFDLISTGVWVSRSEHLHFVAPPDSWPFFQP